MSNRLDRIPIGILTVMTTVYVGLFFYYVDATAITQPFWDMYFHVLRYLEHREDSAPWAYLWEPHVQHRPVWIRLLTAFDVEVFSGIGYPFLIVATACQLVTAWLLWREIATAGPARTLNRACGCFVLMLVLTSVSAVDCAIPMDGTYPQALVFVVLSLVLFDGEADRGERVGRWIHGRRAAALLAAVGAAFGNAAGLVMWPILAWAAWRVRAGRMWLTAVAVLGLAFGASYLRGLSMAPIDMAVSSDGGGRAGIDHLLKTATYLLTYLGLPWTRAASLVIPGRLVGAALLVVGVGAVLRHGLIAPKGGRLERLAVGLIMFSLASAVLATVGRVDVDPDVRVPVRYSVFMTPAQVAVLFLARPWLARQWMVLGRRRLIEWAMLGAGLILLVQQVAAGQIAASTTRSMKTTIERFLAGERDPDMTRVVFSDLNEAQQAVDTMRRAGVYLRAH